MARWDEDDINVRIRHADPVRFVHAPPRGRFEHANPFLGAERSRSHDRSRSRDRRASSPPAIIVANRFYNSSSSSEDDSDDGHRRRKKSHSRHRRQSYSRSRSRSSSHMTKEEWEAEQARRNLALVQASNEREKDQRRLRDDWEAEQVRKDFESMQMRNDREKDERRLIKEYKEEEKLQRAKRELDDIKGREARASEEERIKKALELKRLREDDAAKEEADRREKEAKDAVERYKQAEKDRIAHEKKIKADKEREAEEAVERYKQAEKARILKEKQEKEASDREYNHRLEDDLRRSGLDDKAIQAILKKEKIKKEEHKQPPHEQVLLHHVPPHRYDVPAAAFNRPPAAFSPHANFQEIVPVHHAPPPAVARPTYTRMARKHLSLETLRYYDMDWEIDMDPEYVLIRHWVPEDQQDMLWRHTRKLREKRKEKGVLLLEEKAHRQHLEPEFEWVRKKEKRSRSRSRSKSPGLLMYFAGKQK